MMTITAAQAELTTQITALAASQIAALATRAPKAANIALARDLDQLRSLAHRHGLHSVASVARMIGLAAATGGQRAMIGEWIGLLGEAVGSARHDHDAAQAYAGMCSVRLAG